MNGTKTRKNNDSAMFEQEIIDGLIRQHSGFLHKCVSEASTNAVCDYEDLEQEGRMAVVHAYRTFDPEKGPLNAWVCRCIKDAILDYQKNNLRFLSGGEYLQAAMKKAGPDATIEDIMAQGVSKETALVSTYFNLRPAQYGEALNLIDIKAKHQMEEIEACHLDYKKYLTEKEVFAIEHRFGLGYCDVLTMEEIGKRLGKSKKAVSYLINQALVKLRHVKGIEEYSDF